MSNRTNEERAQEGKRQERFRKFGLNIAPEKSFKKLFSRFRKRESERFDFLGFEFRWGKTRNGVDVIKLRTSRKKLRKSPRNSKLPVYLPTAKMIL